jgi:Sister chromatid cohesion C-terminus
MEGYYEHAGEPIALISSLYKDIKSKKRVRSKFLKNLVSYLDREPHTRDSTPPISVDFAHFIVENLLYLDYATIEEPLTVIHSIDAILSSTGVALRQTIETRDSTGQLPVVAQRSIVFSLMIGLKAYLKGMYNLTEAKVRGFDPRKTVNAKDNKPVVKAPRVGIVEWPDIPFLEKSFQTPMDMEEQLEAVIPRPRFRWC